MGEKRVKRVVPRADGLVRGHLAIGLDAMLKAVELPTGIADLASGLANVDGDALTLEGKLSCLISVINGG